MKWYFTINDFASTWLWDVMRVSVTSALERTNLQPVCLYDGNDDMLKFWMSSNGVPVIQRKVPFADRLHSDEVVNRNAGRPYRPQSAEGFYLLLEIPFVEANDEFVLFTDADVMFTGQVDLSAFKPAFLAACPEVDISNPSLEPTNHGFNSGVMVMNVPAMRQRMQDVYLRLEQAGYFSFDDSGAVYDQGVLNSVFKGQWDALPMEYNWRACFPENRDSKIIHWHGPKPRQVRDVISGQGGGSVTADMAKLLEGRHDNYRHHLAIFDDFMSRTL